VRVPKLNFAGEHDQQHEFGITILVHGWTLDCSHFRTAAHNFPIMPCLALPISRCR
jgi:hypothetical protein